MLLMAAEIIDSCVNMCLIHLILIKVVKSFVRLKVPRRIQVADGYSNARIVHFGHPPQVVFMFILSVI